MNKRRRTRMEHARYLGKPNPSYYHQATLHAPIRQATKGLVLRVLRSKLGPQAHVGSTTLCEGMLVTHGGMFFDSSGYHRLLGPCYSWLELLIVVNNLEV